jgi:hypothetical protein
MENHFPLLLLAFFVLSACQPTPKDNQQLISTLIESNRIMSRSTNKILYDIGSTTDVKTQYRPIYQIGDQIEKAANELDDELEYTLKKKDAKDIDYSALFAKYTTFCTFAKNKILYLKEQSDSGKIYGVKILQEKLDTFFKYSTLVGKMQKPLSQADFEQLNEQDLQIYLLTLQLDISSGVLIMMSYLRDNIWRDHTPSSLSFQIIPYAPKYTIVLGEEFTAEIYFAPYYQKPINFKLNIDGDSIPIENSKGIYRSRPTKTGTHSYTINATYTDPSTGESSKTVREFKYEVLPAKKF